MALLLPEADKVALAATSGAPAHSIGWAEHHQQPPHSTTPTSLSLPNLDSAASSSEIRGVVGETVLLKWLGGPDYISIRRSVLERRMEGTVTWFLELKEFKQLVDDTGVILMGNWVA
ncbi:hypothetical protein DFP72DRAFT_859612 [Ephemerocybe angulata]|uniref:Uncharacterized protein n=1 Tax=Ephemerocybe angulata TaxID=980116 RepID=A0A8H6LVV1_9AGAR|nr:hypothetical protein DFP72DRAFT_859612 [Tulosesus angulatus]